jgi:putative membrane protein
MKNKKLIFGAIFLFINGFFVAKVPEATNPDLAWVSAIFVIVLAIPSFWALKNWLGIKSAGAIIMALGAFALFIENIAIATGLPYGEFEYGEEIGGKILEVPWTVFFSWSPLVLGAYSLSANLLQRNKPSLQNAGMLVALSVVFLLLTDGVLDPGAVQQEFWKYKAGGLYYGVPFSNFIGWIISGAIGAGIVYGLSGKRKEAPVSLISSLVLVLAFWTSIAIFANLVFPAMLGAALLSWCFREIQNSSC